jgi:hypothetical protein
MGVRSSVRTRGWRAGRRSLLGIAAVAMVASALPAAAVAQEADPRVGLGGGLFDAESAISNLEHLASLPKPDGVSGTNSDLAFHGDHVVSGNYSGFNIYDVSDPADPDLVSSTFCPGSQNDVSVYGDLLFLSVEANNARIDCLTGGVTAQNRFRGIRIFDISDIENPQNLGGVQTCRGSHTHSVLEAPDDPDHIYIYNSSMAGIRSGNELAGCNGNSSLQDPTTANFRIDVIRVPLASPEDAAIVSYPRIFSVCGSSACIDDFASGALNGLSAPGPQPTFPEGDLRFPGGQSVAQTFACHDITIYEEIGLAAGACQGDGILLDISDPAEPVRIDNVTDPNFAYWHSATFNNDGTTVIFTDEWGGGGQPRCRPQDPDNWGANAIFDIVQTDDGPRMELASYYKLPAPQTAQENCVAHNGSLIPVPGRDIMVQAWYQGGTSVFDFTDSANPFEIAFFDRGPVNPNGLSSGGYWSSYWNDGYIYGNEIARGFDVFRLVESDHLSANEIAVAESITMDQPNVQNQKEYSFEPTFTLAKAYNDQALRGGTLDRAMWEKVDRFVSRAEGFSAGPQRRAALATLGALTNDLRDREGTETLVATIEDLVASLG